MDCPRSPFGRLLLREAGQQVLRRMTAPVYPKEDITQGIFSFDSMGFCVNDFRRETAKSLRRVLFPEFTVSEKALNSACVEAARTMSKDWIIAQLQHYAIEVNPEIDRYKAKALLVTSVAHGLVSNVFLAGFMGLTSI